ncbi:release factor glutamine methyltransferase [Spinactinospora alkalitolerans]|uniref:Release factor glutamine methyltransferase n=1 Tax=Spinactinospora alkalitolerans TaxID=687207 RepID=A0A852TT42_9ACTN|nr:50S ribosomal protein L11 methyltransferase [Spinactinospora alkalitolerans]NYE47098.1 release factor glutamine methyltransferase [Spinactinospora alkalitolerans]
MERSLIAQLPPPLPAEQIIALNRPKEDLHTTRSYAWNGWDFEVPPRVFLPGATSRMIHQRILDDDIDVRGRRYAAMGVGLGVEAVVAGLRGAERIYAVDVHPQSVAATKQNYERLAGGRTGSTLVPVVSDMFEGLPDGVRLDVVTFNPPAVSQPVSSDPDIVRNVCAGAPVTEALFTQLRRRELLAPGAEVFLVASNTADLRRIVGQAEDTGFTAEVRHRHDWGDGVVTHLFRLQREGAA